MLGIYPEFNIVGQASSGAEALNLHTQLLPDLTLMDVRLPGMDGIAALTAIRAATPAARVVMLSSEDYESQVFRAMVAGASGYLLKTASHSHFAKELKHAHQHGWCQPYTPEYRHAHKHDPARLTSREIEVLSCLRRGLSNADIALALDISVETAITHVKSLLVKMGAANRTEAVSRGYETGMLRTGDDS